MSRIESNIADDVSGRRLVATSGGSLTQLTLPLPSLRTSSAAIVNLPRFAPLCRCRRDDYVEDEDEEDARAYRGVSEPISRDRWTTDAQPSVAFRVRRVRENRFVTLLCILSKHLVQKVGARQRKKGRKRGRRRKRERKREKRPGHSRRIVLYVPFCHLRAEADTDRAAASRPMSCRRIQPGDGTTIVLCVRC